jgi:signal transduction histidine kinase
MGVIQGHAKKLEKSVQGEDATWRLQTIQEQIGRISRIIQVLLNMARPRASRRQPVELGPLLERTLSFVSEKLARRHIEVTTSLEATRSVVGDAERLQQLFLNLFLNAADAMAEGGRLRISLCEDDGQAQIRVADTGSGIRAQDLPQIFDPFFTTKPAGEGNGLGLMVCKGIVADHGGVIEAESEVGQGTEFRIRIPLAGVVPSATRPDPA